MTDNLNKKLLGAFYTPQDIAHFLVDRLRQVNPKTALEPSFGDGIFIKSLKKKYPKIDVLGVELSQKTIMSAHNDTDIKNCRFICDDYLMFEHEPVDIIVGNPPFVRTRNLNEKLKLGSDLIMKKYWGSSSPKDISVWLPFVLKSIHHIKKGGSLSFVLPYEITFVNYAKPLWFDLLKNFGNVEVIRIKKRIFSDLMQEVVLLCATEKGKNTNFVSYKGYAHLDDANSNKTIFTKKISQIELVQNSKAFKYAMLNNETHNFLVEKFYPASFSVKEVCDFHIGYVSGQKEFFHPSKDTINKFKLSSKNLIPTIAEMKFLHSCKLFTSEGDKKSQLYYPQTINKSDIDYINYGESKKFHTGYKCRIRSPWYKVPLVNAPDILLSVFKETPSLLINDARLLATNSILCGYLKAGYDPLGFAIRWFNPITLLLIELEIHSLGGGVLVFVPSEVGNLRLPKLISIGDLKQTPKNIRGSGIKKGYLTSGFDSLALNNINSREIEISIEAMQDLVSWRVSDKVV